MDEKEKEILIQEAESAVEDKQLKVDQYRMYNYFKEHSSTFLAATSAFIAIISLVLNFAVFLSANSYLMYFKVDNVIYKSSTSFLYMFAITLILLTIIILLQGFLSKTFDSYLPYKKRFLLLKYYFKEIKSDIKSGKKLTAALQKSIDDSPDTFSEGDRKELEGINESARELEGKYRSTKRKMNRNRLIYCVLIGLSCLLMWGVLSVVCALMLSIASYEWRQNVFFATIFSAILVLIPTVENWFLSCVLRLNKKKIKVDAELDYEKIILKYSDMPEFPITQVLSGKFKSFFNDSNCKRFVATVMCCLTILLFAASWSGSQNAETQKDFFIIELNEQTYALIYNNGENAVVEKAEINDGEITIDTTHQKIISAIDIDMQKHTFDNVYIVRTKRNNVGDQTESVENAESVETTDIVGGE